MCGIAGYLDHLVNPSKKILSCLNLMKRRGPDAQKYKLKIWKKQF